MAAVTRTIRRGSETLELTAGEGDSLLEVARRAMGVRSASLGCQDGSCGACRLLVDGEVVNACELAWRDVASGARVESYEDVAGTPAAVRAIEAFHAERPTRCTLCVGALGVTAVALERVGHAGDPDAVEAALRRATCVCTGRGSLRRALLVVPR
jgi:aerobic-type carbon monoxide dehydrogenase small subunit (CoxS/CutS family)